MEREPSFMERKLPATPMEVPAMAVNAYEGYLWLAFAVNHPREYQVATIEAQMLEGGPGTRIIDQPLPTDSKGIRHILQDRLAFVLSETGYQSHDGIIDDPELVKLQILLTQVEAVAKAVAVDLIAQDPAIYGLQNPFNDPEVLRFLIHEHQHRTGRLLPLDKLAPNYQLAVEAA